LRRDAAGDRLHNQAAEYLYAQMSKLDHRERRIAGAVAEIVHQTDGAHAGRRRLAHRLEHCDGAAVQMRRRMNVAVYRTHQIRHPRRVGGKVHRRSYHGVWTISNGCLR
jgi:hypothetical protein